MTNHNSKLIGVPTLWHHDKSEINANQFNMVLKLSILNLHILQVWHEQRTHTQRLKETIY